MLDLYPKFRSRRTGKEGTTLLEVVGGGGGGGGAGVRPGHVCRRITALPVEEQHRSEGVWREGVARLLTDGEFTRDSLVEGVDEVVRVPEVFRGLLLRGAGGRVRGVEAVASVAVRALRAALERLLDGVRSVVMFHSSGLDSRIVASLLPSWVDNRMYVAWQPELPEVQAVWDSMGVPEEWRYPLEGPEDRRYYRPLLGDVGWLGRHISATDRLACGPLLAEWVHASEGERVDWARKGRVFVSGLWSDESIAWNRWRWRRLASFVVAWALDGMGPLGGMPRVFPYASQEWLQVLTMFHVPRGDDFKAAMLREIDPTGRVLEVPNAKYRVGRRPLTTDWLTRSTRKRWRDWWPTGPRVPTHLHDHDALRPWLEEMVRRVL